MAKLKKISNGFNRYADDGTTSLDSSIVAAPTDSSSLPTSGTLQGVVAEKCNVIKNLFHIGNCPSSQATYPDTSGSSIDTTATPQATTSQFDDFLNALIKSDATNSASSDTGAAIASGQNVNLPSAVVTPAATSSSSTWLWVGGGVVGAALLGTIIYLLVRKKK